MSSNGKQAAGQHNKKKKKGRSPAHQNTFSFQHNPNSKKTKGILDLPNEHLCRRCHDKIEWRKKYRKYKPRTQPGTCNICRQRNVKAAYHTVCATCTTSTKAKIIVRDSLAGGSSSTEERAPTAEVQTSVEGQQLDANETPSTTAAAVTEEKEEVELKFKGHRACAMCVKEFALRCSSDNEGEYDPLASGKRMPLRQRKTLERQRDRKEELAKAKKEDDVDNEDLQAENETDMISEDDEMDETSDNGDEGAEDPFLKAVGGADQLLTGEAYQQSLLQKEQEMQS